MQEKWQRLQIHKNEGLPPLLFKFISTSKGYEMYITDLTQLWSEQLSYRQVLKRAEQDDTTIDPSEDAEQYNVLLQKVDEALHGSPESKMALTGGSKADSLELSLSTNLPAPLEPLKWRLYLSKEPHTASTNHLLLPLLRAERGRESSQQTLLEQLKQKDWVLAKLLDKIEAMGIDLSTVFPGTSGLRGARKESSLAQATKYIKGVAPFDEKTWLNELHKSSPELDLAFNLITETCGADAFQDPGALNPPPDKWWESLSARGTVPVTPEPEKRKAKPAPEPEPERTPAPKALSDTRQMDIDTASEDEEDGFERQETPPRFKKQKQPEKEQEPEQPPKRKSPSPPPQKAQQKPAKGLGKIGGKAKQPTKQPSPSPPPPQQPPSSTASSPDLERGVPESANQAKPPSATPSDQETDSGSEEKEDRRPSPSPPPLSPPKPKEPQQKRPRGGLGVIGGKKKEQKREPTPTPPAPSPPPEEPPTESPKQDTPASQPEPKPKRAGKLGIIGGKAKAKAGKEPEKEKSPDSTQKETAKRKPETKKPAPSRSPSPQRVGIRPKKEEEDEKPLLKANEPEPEPEREETEQEKANRKREELKRQLEAKSKAPAKKKRKF